MAKFTNQAQLRYGNAVANSNITVGEILEVLSASKTAVWKNYGQNDTVTYSISIVNAGTAAVGGLTFTDKLGAYTFDTKTLTPLNYVEGTIKYYINGVLQDAPAVTAGPPLVVTGIQIPAGGNAQILYETQVNEYAPLGVEGYITNQAVLSGGGITPVTVGETVNAQNGPVLTITKSVSPVPVTENGTLTYTFLIQNFGNTPADEQEEVVVTDTFQPILSGLTVSYNGTAWTAGEDYTYDETTGLFTTTAGKITIPGATYQQNADTGVWSVSPGSAVLVVKGTL